MERFYLPPKYAAYVGCSDDVVQSLLSRIKQPTEPCKFDLSVLPGPVDMLGNFDLDDDDYEDCEKEDLIDIYSIDQDLRDMAVTTLWAWKFCGRIEPGARIPDVPELDEDGAEIMGAFCSTLDEMLCPDGAMMPNIMPLDLVTYDKYDTKVFSEPLMFAVKHERKVKLRLVRRSPDGSLLLSSLNSNYPEIKAIPGRGVAIMGRAIYFKRYRKSPDDRFDFRLQAGIPYHPALHYVYEPLKREIDRQLDPT